MATAFLDHGIDHLVVFNGHTGNSALIDQTVRKIRAERGIAIPSINIWQILPQEVWTKLFGADAGKTIAAYKTNNPGATPPELYFLIVSDLRLGADTYKLAERRAALGKGPVYLYYFTWKSPMAGGKYISPHTLEIPFAFDTLKTANLTKDAPDAPALMEKVSAA